MVAAGTCDARIHLDRVSQAAEQADTEEVWGALVDLFLLLEPGSAGMRARALFWGRPVLQEDQHQLLADHLDSGLRWCTPVHPRPRRSLHWRGVVGRCAVEVHSPEVAQRPEQIEFDPRGALSRLLQTGVGTAELYRPARTPTDGAARGTTPPGGKRRPPTQADHRVAAALTGRPTGNTPLGQDDQPQCHTGPTLVDSVERVLESVGDDRQARALVGTNGILHFHPDRTVDVDVTEVQLTAWCEPPLRANDLSIRQVDGQARGHRILTWDQLRWDLGSRCAAGSFPADFDLQAPLVLKAAPDVSHLRRLPGDFTVLGLLREQPLTIAEVRTEGVELRHLAALVGAMTALGVLGTDPAQHLADDTNERADDSPPSLFDRIRSSLGGW